MTERTQAYRPVKVKSELEDDVLLFSRMSLTESLSRPFIGELELRSDDFSIDFNEVLGTKLTVEIALPNNKYRYFNGFVSRFVQTGGEGGQAVYEATLVPWIWFLSLTSDCYIFQDQTVPAIVKNVLENRHKFPHIEDKLSEDYRTWKYCVQYRETDFNFIHRLLEQEGIYYYFTYSDGNHSLVLADSISAHESFPGYEVIAYKEPAQAASTIEFIWGWSVNREVQPGSYSLNDYDFEKPREEINARSIENRKHPVSEMSVYDYPGEYTERKDGDRYAAVRLGELQARHEVLEGQSDARGIATGCKFKLTECPRRDQNREYLITEAVYEITADEYTATESGSGGFLFSCNFTAIPSQQPYRPPRVTPKPMVQGPQTAIVVGPSNEEIYTDKEGFGRVKVKFHWDRHSEGNPEKSSCWIRVAQVWAGSKWGGIYLPRVGQEVIVEFLEGDPDRPIITGRVYNKDNMPPYDLPGQKTLSGVKSRSSIRGNVNNFNEIRLDDKKGEEHIFIQAEKNQDIRVKNDCFEWIGNNRHLIVKTDQKEQVENNRHENIGADHMEEIGKDRHLKVKGKEAKGVDGSHSFTVKGDVIEVFKSNHSEQVTNDYYLKGDNIVIEAMTNVTVKVGQSYVAIEAGGIKIGTAGQIVLEATNTTVKGDAMTTIQGGIVKIN